LFASHLGILVRDTSNRVVERLQSILYAQNYGGEVEVLSLEAGKCTVRYTGPAPIGMGVKAAVKDKFPDISEVILVD